MAAVRRAGRVAYTAKELGEQLLRLAQQEPGLSLLPEAHRTLGEPLLWLGEFRAAHKHLEQGSQLYNPEQHSAQAFLYGLDPGVANGAFAAQVLWFLGYPDQALQRIDEALTLAQDSAHLPSFSLALCFAAWVHLYCREGQAAQERAETAMALSTEQGVPFFLAFGTIFRGWALVEQDQVQAGSAQMRQGIAAYRATGAELAWPLWTAVVANGYGQKGQAEEGQALLAEAMEGMQQTGQHAYEAELYRLKGELLLNDERGMMNDERKTHEAEVCFHKAIDVARQQAAKSWELSAAMSLARLWQRQGKTTEAHGLLAPVYAWFTEGFETADLKDAKRLLDTL